MPATNYTPIQLYRTATATGTAPVAGNLNFGELAINYNDGGMLLYAKNASGTIIKLMNNPANLLYPRSDGTSGQAVVTNGSGTLSFATIASLSGQTDSAIPYETALGSGAGAVSTGVNNTFIGFEAGNDNTTGTNNTAVGYQALDVNTTGVNNTAVGSAALGANTTGYSNTAVGYQALNANTTGVENTAVGGSALSSANGATRNTAVGIGAAALTTTATNNVAIGAYNTASGDTGTLRTNTTGSFNIAIGNGALRTNSTASYNVAIGDAAMYYNTTGANNTAVGYAALTANTTGVNNTAVGYQALDANTTGTENAAVGYGAMGANTTGQYNVGFGKDAIASVTTGSHIVGVGFSAGTTITTGTYGVYIGSGAAASAAGASGEIVICHYQRTGKGNNTGFINPGDGGVYQGNNSASWSTTSDRRLKKNIVDNNQGIDVISQIRVRNFEYRLPEEVDAELKPTDAVKKEGIQLGVIAQELQEVCPDCVKEESTGVLSVDSDNVFWHMLNAIKELSAQVTALQAEVNALKG